MGDSGIVLGYQEDGEPAWRAKRLTQDHKPESPCEKARISSSGGKVVDKAGVYRVVWRRAKLGGFHISLTECLFISNHDSTLHHCYYHSTGHQGPIRRSTHVDEIPFLAVARSLGDLWSYNSERDEFVVSPEPDVRVIRIDPKKFRCLIFGTDGLWNVVKAEEAVRNVQQAEQTNQRNINPGGPREWTNPSKALVDKALEVWASSKFRADNTSVVIIMLDPPGPPRRDVLRSYSTSPYPEYLPNLMQPVENQVTVKPEPAENFTVFDHRTNARLNLDPIPAPTSGLVTLKRTESDEDYLTERGYSVTTDASHMDVDVRNVNILARSLMCHPNRDAEHSQVYNSSRHVHIDHNATDCHQASSGICAIHPNIPVYTKLETRSEQQIKSQQLVYNETSSWHEQSHSTVYSDNHGHNYVSVHGEAYGTTSSGYAHAGGSGLMRTTNSAYSRQATAQVPPEPMDDEDSFESPSNCSILLNESGNDDYKNTKTESEDTDSDEDTPARYIADQSIQINEISSSNNDLTDQNNDIHPNTTSNRANEINTGIEKKRTRSATAKSNELRRSSRSDGKSRIAKVLIKANERKPLTSPNSIVGSTTANSNRIASSKSPVIIAATLPQLPASQRATRSKNPITKVVKRLSGATKRIQSTRQNDVKAGKRTITRNEGRGKNTVQTQRIKNIKNNNNNNNNNVPIINHSVVVTRSTRAMHN